MSVSTSKADANAMFWMSRQWNGYCQGLPNCLYSDPLRFWPGALPTTKRLTLVSFRPENTGIWINLNRVESCVENKGKTGHNIWYTQVRFPSIVFISYNRCVILGQYKKQLRNWSNFHNLIQATTKSAGTHCSRVTHTSVKFTIGSSDTLILNWHHPLRRIWLFAYVALYQMQCWDIFIRLL